MLYEQELQSVSTIFQHQQQHRIGHHPPCHGMWHPSSGVDADTEPIQQRRNKWHITRPRMPCSPEPKLVPHVLLREQREYIWNYPILNALR